MIYLAAIGLTPGGSSTHLHTNNIFFPFTVTCGAFVAVNLPHIHSFQTCITLLWWCTYGPPGCVSQYCDTEGNTDWYDNSLHSLAVW
jgi:hypothetical protein